MHRALGREDCFVNHNALPVEVVITVVIFNTFMTQEAEGAGVCKGAQYGRYTPSCSRARRLCTLPASTGGEARVALVGWGVRTLSKIWPIFAK